MARRKWFDEMHIKLVESSHNTYIEVLVKNEPPMKFYMFPNPTGYNSAKDLHKLMIRMMSEMSKSYNVFTKEEDTNG